MVSPSKVVVVVVVMVLQSIIKLGTILQFLRAVNVTNAAAEPFQQTSMLSLLVCESTNVGDLRKTKV